MNKLEAHIMNQRKKLSQYKSQIDILNNEKHLLEQCLKTSKEMVNNIEKQGME